MKSVTGILFLLLTFSAAAGDRFVHQAAGFEVHKPEGWHFVQPGDSGAVAQRVSMAALQPGGVFLQGAQQPLVSIAKYPVAAAVAGIVPTVTILRMEIMGEIVLSPSIIMAYSHVGLRQRAAGFEYLTRPSNIRLQGQEAAFSEMRYRIADGQSAALDVRARNLLIPRGGHALLIVMTGPEHGPDNGRREFGEILASLKLK